MNQALQDPIALLDRTYERLRDGTTYAAMSTLFDGLGKLRRRLNARQWEDFSRQTAISHPLRSLIHEDPMTRRSFDKPRGYPGDAVLLDFIYRIAAPSDATEVGRAVHDYAIGRAAACAVRHRRAFLAHEIDRAADEAEGAARILSLACGHLREAELSSALQNGWLDSLLALDADANSLAVIERLQNPHIECRLLSVGRLLARWRELGQFHFAYSAGLYDYLDRPLGTRLTRCLFDMLRPGGRLLVSNFLPEVADAGYMESYMGWELLLRTPAALQKLAADVPRDQIASVRTFADPFQAIVYLEVVRSETAQAP